MRIHLFRTPVDAGERKKKGAEQLFVSQTMKRWVHVPTNYAIRVKYFWHTVGRKRFSTGFVLQQKEYQKRTIKAKLYLANKVTKSMGQKDARLPLAARKMSFHVISCGAGECREGLILLRSGLHVLFFFFPSAR